MFCGKEFVVGLDRDVVEFVIVDFKSELDCDN